MNQDQHDPCIASHADKLNRLAARKFQGRNITALAKEAFASDRILKEQNIYPPIREDFEKGIILLVLSESHELALPPEQRENLEQGVKVITAYYGLTDRLGALKHRARQSLRESAAMPGPEAA